MHALSRIFKAIVFLCLLYTSWLMLNLSVPYLEMKPGIDFLQTKELIYHVKHWRYSFYIHVFTGLFALVAGMFQFSSYLIRNQKLFHRITGYIYLVDVLFITGPAALVMAFYANGGLPARASFVLLGALWLLSSAMAWKAALRKRFAVHGAWMLRSYALTLSAITLRTYAYLFGYFHTDMRPVEVYITIAWLSWVPNLVVAEILIRRGFVRSLLRRSSVSA